MRIIAGIHRGRKLSTLEGNNTRPMMDRMKEAIFQIMGPFFDGGKVLDPFGGSGALSLEALSRGAAFAYISDASMDAIRVINKNITLLKENVRTKVMYANYEKVIQTLNQESFDLVFLDPPYHLNVSNNIIENLIELGMLKKGAYVVCHFVKGNMQDVPQLTCVRSKVYGNSEWRIYQNGM